MPHCKERFLLKNSSKIQFILFFRTPGKTKREKMRNPCIKNSRQINFLLFQTAKPLLLFLFESVLFPALAFAAVGQLLRITFIFTKRSVFHKNKTDIIGKMMSVSVKAVLPQGCYFDPIHLYSV